MNEEIWKDIEGYEGLYQVSNLGRVKSLGNDKSRKEKILRPVKTRKGYLQIGLIKNGERKWYKVHRLVLSTFNPVENMHELQVNHINECKTDNSIKNLEWVTCKENINHGTRNDRIAEKLRGKVNTKNSIPVNSIPVVQVTLNGKYIRSWKSSHDAKREGGYNQAHIIQCCKNKYMREGNNIYKGFKWMYLSEYMDKYNGIID